MRETLILTQPQYDPCHTVNCALRPSRTPIAEMSARRPRLTYGVLFIVASIVLWGTASWVAGSIIWV
ncbi:protein of unknown function [Methylorubrum extorquens]|uniref:Uncharacterized protein n=1 Tax=Methylorubrum extorquens TaxID=408 RepID=A0A2N9ASP7_METEX|nr:protein of unknown function [Methylorubrum extorquens]